MSGTSLDGVDAVLVRFAGEQPECTAGHYQPFPPDLVADLLALQHTGPDELGRAARASRRLAGLYADAVAALLLQAGTPATAVRAIGCHGQTVRHAPAEGYTLQLNDPALLAERSGIAVVADFRSRDIAAGGQGAPLVPAFHAAVFGDPRRHRVIVNIGGIANLTDLPPGGLTTGFDCGPGNMLLDAWIGARRQLPFDRDGAWAAQGRVDSRLLARLLAHPFLALPPPKSCGREQFNLGWLRGQLAGDETEADVQATLAALTVRTVADAIRNRCGAPAEVLVCGGGARNGHLMAMLAAELPASSVATTARLGLPVDRVEAAAFAWLARRRLYGQPGNLPAVTGARGPRILGAIYPA
jgi:anhydro-N-acetylmuramic acid kinase